MLTLVCSNNNQICVWKSVPGDTSANSSIKLFKIRDKAYLKSAVTAGESLTFNDKDSN